MSDQIEDREEQTLPDPFVISSDEMLMRRILCDPKHYKKGVVLDAAFMPRKPNVEKGTDQDADGISLHRKAFLSPEAFRDCCLDIRLRASIGVAELPYQLFVELKLTVVPDQVIPDPPERPGHVAIKEITSAFYKLDPDSQEYREIRGWAIDLAKACINLPIIPSK